MALHGRRSDAGGLKEAKGIGTPATRDEIIRGLETQELLAADGKHIVPTERGLALFAGREKADPALVDAGVRAQMKGLLDAVLVGQPEMIGAVDAMYAQASRIIGRLQEGASGIDAKLLGGVATDAGPDRLPTPAMKDFMDGLARQKGLKPPRGYTSSGAPAAPSSSSTRPSGTEHRRKLMSGAGDLRLFGGLWRTGARWTNLLSMCRKRRSCRSWATDPIYRAG